MGRRRRAHLGQRRHDDRRRAAALLTTMVLAVGAAVLSMIWAPSTAEPGRPPTPAPAPSPRTSTAPSPCPPGWTVLTDGRRVMCARASPLGTP